jgi:hypothetical protein
VYTPPSPYRIALICCRFFVTSSLFWTTTLRQRSPHVFHSSSSPKSPTLTFLLVSPPGALVSSRGIASLSPRTRSGGVLGFVLKKFIVPAIGDVLFERKKREKDGRCGGCRDKDCASKPTGASRRAVAFFGRGSLSAWRGRGPSSSNGACHWFGPVMLVKIMRVGEETAFFYANLISIQTLYLQQTG